MISAKNIFMAYTKDYNILHNVSLHVEKGEKVVLLGDEGSGKTSLIRIILGLETNFDGDVRIEGVPVKKVNFKTSFSALYISSRGAFLERKSCFKNIEYVLKLRGINPKTNEVLINSALKTYGIFSYKEVRAKNLSPFNRIMLQLARASFRDNIELICVDDVFINLSVAERNQVIKHLNNLNMAKNATSIIACSGADLAKQIGGRTVKISLGSVENEN